jgi:1,4-dihydroxy-2-naphthoate octaprenyltransferase
VLLLSLLLFLALRQVGHVLARHHAERISQMNATGIVNLLLRLLLGISIPGPLILLGMFLPYSR